MQGKCIYQYAAERWLPAAHPHLRGAVHPRHGCRVRERRGVTPEALDKRRKMVRCRPAIRVHEYDVRHRGCHCSQVRAARETLTATVDVTGSRSARGKRFHTILVCGVVDNDNRQLRWPLGKQLGDMVTTAIGDKDYLDVDEVHLGTPLSDQIRSYSAAARGFWLGSHSEDLMSDPPSLK